MDGSQGPAGQQPAGSSGEVPATRPLSRDRVRPGAPRVAALDALLRDVDALRTTLQTDLSLAAGALEAGEPGLAASVLDGDRVDVAGFEQRALGHLAALQAADAGDAAAAREDAEVRTLPSRSARRTPRRLPRRLTRVLPAAPLVAAAAALVGLFGALPGGSSREAPTTDLSGAALSSWAELERLSADDAPADEVQQAARSLNADLASMVAEAGGDPVAARQALDLLRRAQAVLSADDDADQLRSVLQQSQVLAARLLASLPPVAPELPSAVRSAVDRLPVVTSPPVTRPVPARARPTPRRTDASGAAANSTTTRGASRPTTVPRPRSGTGPSVGPTAEPTPGTTPDATFPDRPPSLPTAGIDPPLG